MPIFTSGFLVALILSVAGGKLPAPVLDLYLAVSMITCVLYAADKWAAQRARRRVPERLLHLFGLLGGWPGGLFAQRLLRHKTAKRPFQRRFLVTVLINCALLVAIVLL